MPKIPKKYSLNISIAIAVLLLLICVVGLCLLPNITNMLIDTPDGIGNRDNISASGRMIVHILAYIIVLFVMAADVCLFFLLLRVRAGMVFTATSVSLIRCISWCCILICAAFCGLGVFFQLAFFIAFAALFLGTCLRVVKNTIEEATEIKSENDLTV